MIVFMSVIGAFFAGGVIALVGFYLLVAALEGLEKLPRSPKKIATHQNTKRLSM